MKKIVVRKKILPIGYANSAFIEICKEKEYKSLQELLLDYDRSDVIKRLYSEEINNSNLGETDMYRLYQLAHESGEDNELFKIMYSVDDEFAVHLTENIYLYHMAVKKEEVYSLIVPWHYADSEKYIGDTWWEKDKEIIENLKSLSIIDFFRRYKGY